MTDEEILTYQDIDNFYDLATTDANIDYLNSIIKFRFNNELLTCVPIYDNYSLRPSEIGRMVMILVARYGLVPGEDYDRIWAGTGVSETFFQFKTLESFTIAALALK